MMSDYNVKDMCVQCRTNNTNNHIEDTCNTKHNHIITVEQIRYAVNKLALANHIVLMGYGTYNVIFHSYLYGVAHDDFSLFHCTNPYPKKNIGRTCDSSN